MPPVTFTAPLPQPAMAKAVILEIHLDPEAQIGTAVYQAQDNAGNPINGGQVQRLPLTFAQLGITKAGVYNVVLAAAGLTGTVT
jgi:hypothetical protein